MTPSLADVFAEHDDPTHASKREIHDQLAVILAIGADVQKQMIEYRSKLMAAQLVDDTLTGQMEHMHQTFGAAEREATTFVTAGRNLAMCFTQLDRYMAEQRARLDKAVAAGVAVTG